MAGGVDLLAPRADRVTDGGDAAAVDGDVRAPRPVADALLAALPNAELVVVPGAGHYINIAAPDAFDTELRRFLSSVGPG